MRTMRQLMIPALAGLMLCTGCQGKKGFVEGTSMGVAASHPKQYLTVFVDSHTGAGLQTFPEGQWTTIDVSGVVPEETKAVFLTGMLSVTGGQSDELCDLTVGYRASGETNDPSYLAESMAAGRSAGQRTPHSTWIPVRGGKFDLHWRRSTQGAWPEHCAYGIRLHLVAYLR